MARYVFDIETDGLLDTISTIHSLVLKEIDTGVVYSYTPEDLDQGLFLLSKAGYICGHNVITYDLPAIKKVYPKWETKAEVFDTIVVTRLIWPSDLLLVLDSKNPKFPGALIGRHSLKAWGRRLGNLKGNFEGPWDKWTPEMQAYCEQDVEVTHDLFTMLEKKDYSKIAIKLEHDVQEIVFRQEQVGVPFNEEEAVKLYASLVGIRAAAEKELAGLFAPWYQGGALFTPKRDNKRSGYVAGAEMQHIKLIEFNPGSRHHIGRCLMKKGWKPKAFGSDGAPTVDEKILAGLPYPEAKRLVRYLLIQKRIGQLAEGKKALLKHVKNGRIHGEVMTNGTVTGRAAHMNPNLGQVPKVKKGKDKLPLLGEAGLWGWEFRNLFYAPPGWTLVGVDASGLEMRMLGNQMARWDGGAYALEVIEGDIHALTMAALGITDRDKAKTWIYAWLYGAGDKKLGAILGSTAAKGRQSREVFLNKLPALGKLIAAAKQRHQTRKYIIGLDGRHVTTRSDHSALNSLLQCDGSLVVKFWMVALDRALVARGWKWGVDYAQVLYVHDELQFLCRPEIADELGVIAVETIRKVGIDLGLKVPLDGEAKKGRTWAETH